MDDFRQVEIVVTLWIKADADVSEVLDEMDYSFTHSDIVDTEIRDVITEI